MLIEFNSKKVALNFAEEIAKKAQERLEHSYKNFNYPAKRKKEFLLGRYCAEKSLLELEDKLTTFITIGKASNNQPIFPSGYLGSIAHTIYKEKNYAIACATRDQDFNGIGIDLENKEREANVNLMTRICSGSEIKTIGNNFTALQVFSIKEACFKALATARQPAISISDIVISDSSNKVANFRETKLSFEIIELDIGFFATLASF